MEATRATGNTDTILTVLSFDQSRTRTDEEQEGPFHTATRARVAGQNFLLPHL